MVLSYPLLAAVALAGLASADVCSRIEDLAPSVEVVYKLHPSYISTSNDYWSTACAKLDPQCVAYPETPHDLATILKILNDDAGGGRFAVKSGGHSPNPTWASTDEGPLVSTKKMDHVNLNPETGVVRIGPGLRWDDVADKLDGSGWSAVGGRIGNVGVGGYMMGGGLSFMSQEYGWATSSILEYELVFANGTVANINEDNHPDLFRALKGGGNNFGIVTSFTVQAHRQDDVWGGIIFFPRKKDTDRLILQAVQDFTLHNDDDKAAIIPTAEYTAGGLVDGWILFVYYNGPEPPEETFRNFTDIPHILDTTKTQSMAELVTANNFAVVPGQVYLMGTETIPLPTDASSNFSSQMLPELHAHWRNQIDKVDHIFGMIASIAYQPFPRRIAQLAKESGGDLMEFEDDTDLIIFEQNFSFNLQLDIPEVEKALEGTFNGFRERVLKWTEEGLVPDAYLPLFSNDCYRSQDYYGRLKEDNAQLAQRLAEELDPKGLFRDRTGGWKPQ